MTRLQIKIIFVILIVILALVFPSQSKQTKLAETKSEQLVYGLPISGLTQMQLVDVKTGVIALNNGQWFVANKIFTDLTENSPNLPIGWIGQSIAAESIEQQTRALTKANQLTAVASNAEKTLLSLQNAYLKGDSDKQLSLSKKLVNNDKESGWAWIVRGNALQNAKQIEPARTAFKQAVKVSPNNMGPLLAVGNSLLFDQPKDMLQAEIYFQKAVAIRPTNAWAHINLGDIHRAQQDLSLAHSDYTRASWLEPNNPIAFSKRGHVNSFIGNYSQARQDFDNSLRAGGNEVTWFNNSANFKAFTHLYNNQAKKSLDELSFHLKAIDNSHFAEHQRNQAKLNTLTNMSQIALQENLLPQARQFIESREILMNNLLVNIHDKEFSRRVRANMHFFKGQLQLKEGEINLALQSADKMNLLLEVINDNRKSEDANELKALISMKKEQWRQAIVYFDEADRDKLMVKYHKVLALEQVGETKSAIQLLEEVKSFNFNSVEFAILRNKAQARLTKMSVALNSVSP